ncbi:indolepyruvate oxidoreductase subunit beta [Desulfurococcaceae archaeon MEX13E-LK6-19]|nr:indolepyruvate oxidoreductase subunit beta [Desulfurococcaceae archaeon MEX13E-LK6-19]
MPRYNILLAGVGGQGLLTLGSIIGNAAIEEGIDATIAETHGLSQRGGSLVVHVRLGDGSSPLIPHGGANLIIGLEALETLRYLNYANKDTKIVMNEFLWPPPLSKTPKLEDIIKAISSSARLYVVNANEEAKKVTGLIVTANTLILGFAYMIDKDLQSLLSEKSLEKGLERVFRGKALELNRKALKAGMELAKKTI